MTEIAKTDSGALSPLDEFRKAMGGDTVTGLESVDASDIALPVINIDHAENVFVDKLTGQKYPEIDGVLLGLLKQRIMWDTEMSAPGSTQGPMCKSPDAVTGAPQENFPWPEYKKAGGALPSGSKTIACADCPFAQWGSNPKNDTPWCSLQHVYPVVVGDSENVTGLLTLQRSALKPSSGYLTGFVRDAKPLFTHRTKIRLDANRKGTVKYSVPRFERGEATPEDLPLWTKWAKQYNHIKRTMQGVDLSGSDSVSVSVADADDEPDF